jgi:CheY-like chemotaxis protein
MDKWVLLVEDEIYIKDLYVRILEDSGIKVTTAEDGDSGLNLAQKIPDLILLDIMLPKKNGLEVLTQLKRNVNTSSIPVVLVTNLGQEDVIRHAYGIGAQGYLLKMNLEPEQLIEVTQQFLTNPAYKMDFNTLNFD